MAYPLTLSEPDARSRRLGLATRLLAARADHVDRVRARKTALAISEEARIAAQVGSRRR